jgi:hypothetical protein
LLLQVPIELMSRMSHVPAPYLKQVQDSKLDTLYNILLRHCYSVTHFYVILLLQVPIEVMSCMSHVPAPYLKQLAEDREIFNELPAAVKQQVREFVTFALGT